MNGRPEDGFYQALLDKSYDAVVLLSATGQVTYATAAIERILGYTPAEFVGKTAWELIHPEELDYTRQAMGELVGGVRSGTGMLLRCKHKRGGFRLIEAIGTNLLGDARVNAIVTNMRDVTELRELAETIPDMVLALAGAGAPSYADRRFLEYTGLSLPELETLDRDALARVIHPEDLAAGRGLAEISVRDGTPFSTEVRLRGKQGRYLWHLCRVVPLQNAECGAGRWLVTCTDIDEQARRQERLTAAKLGAEEASREKSTFLAAMSHEMRTPLGAILGFAELMRDPRQPDERRERFLATIERNGRLLARLIDDVLDLSKVEAGRLEIERVPVALPQVLADVLGLLEPEVRAKNLTLSAAAEGPVPELLSTDPTRLKQILHNIVGNAVKFTDSGSVTVAVRHLRATHRGDDGLIAFLVKDTGPGIPAELQPTLFQPFTQADGSPTRRFGGTGLGLVLARRLAQLLGGDVALLDSAPGQGSTFLVTVSAGSPEHGVYTTDLTPRAPPASPEAKPAAVQAPLTGRSVLVVEDTEDNRLLVARFLEAEGARVDTASHGTEGVRLALAGSYDVVVMDLEMPELDGLQATALLRHRGFDKPIVVVTAHLMRGERERSLRAGCDLFLAKPIDRQALVDAVMTLCVAKAEPS